jgi:hypothetical protein
MSSEHEKTTRSVLMRAPGEGLGKRYRIAIDGMTSASATTPIPTKIPKKVDEIEALGIDKGDILEGARPWLEGVSDIKDDNGCSDKIAMQMSVDPEDHGPLPPQSGELKTSAALNVPANPASACSALATKYLPAHTNDKNYMDAMLGASSRSNQLRISFKYPSSSQAPSVSATSPPRSVPTLAACST